MYPLRSYVVFDFTRKSIPFLFSRYQNEAIQLAILPA